MNDIVGAYKKTAASLLNNPDDAESLANQFTLLTARGNRTPAHLALAGRCYNVSRNFISAFNYASALMRAGKESLSAFRNALELASAAQRAVVMHHIGLAHYDRGEYQKALEAYASAFAADPNEPEIGHSIAICKLAMGRLQEGLYEFEVKHHKPVRKAITDSKIPRWKGEDLSGKTVILAHEQGFGDTLQFIRFAPQLKARCKKLIFSGPPVLNDLIKDQFEFTAVVDEQGPFKADYVTSPLAACALLGIEYHDVPNGPYMRSEAMELPKRGKLRVGLSWKGSPGYANDSLRSASLADLCPMFDLPGAAFYSLQVNPGPEEISNLGLDGFIGDLGSLLKTWKDTARAVAAMDVVVTTDTANGHMAGALGKPVLLLLGKAPCWRWGQGASRWYAKTEAFPQEKADDWHDQVMAVRAELAGMIRGR
jgi:tetratricopeptide (TPR) repeat protein